MSDGRLAELSMEFAVNILKLCDGIKSHSSLVNQMERSATNIREANYAHSRPDFIAKLQIALKECYETEYWIERFRRAEIADANTLSGLSHTCGEIRRMLVSSVNTAKNNNRSSR